MVIKKKYFIILFLLSMKLGYAQRSSIGVGFIGGYKSTYQEQGIYIYSRIKNKFDIHGGYCVLGNFNGKGFGSGLRYIPFNGKWQPFVGLGYSYNAGKNVNLKRDSLEPQYKIPQNTFLLYEAGLMFKYVQHSAVSSINAVFLLITNFTYRTKLMPINSTFIGGSYDAKLYNDLQKRVGDGFGVSVSIVIIGNKKRDDDPKIID